MPTPRSGESKDDFLNRCLADAEANRDFPDNSQRFAFCNSTFERSDKSLHGRVATGRRRKRPGMKKLEPVGVTTDGITVYDKALDGVEWTTNIAKIDEEQQIVFGWASIIEENGEIVIDTQDDVIQPTELEKAAYNFVLDARIAGEMHKLIGVGRLIESMVFTKDKQEALGISLNKIGWWIGFKIDDSVTWAKVKTGELSALSIGGAGVREEIEVANA